MNARLGNRCVDLDCGRRYSSDDMEEAMFSLLNDRIWVKSERAWVIYRSIEIALLQQM